MLLDAYASRYAADLANGKELIEDESFDLNQIMDDLEKNDGMVVPDDWEEVEDWRATDSLL